MQHFEDIELLWNDPQSFDNYYIGLIIRDLAIDIIIINDYSDLRMNPFMSEYINDEPARVQQTTCPIPDSLITIIILFKNEENAHFTPGPEKLSDFE